MPKKNLPIPNLKKPVEQIDIEKFKKQLNFSFDLSKTNYQIDALQNELLLTYLRADRKFRKAFSRNYNPQFLQFMKDKARLHEPIHVAVLGQVRSGKSYMALTLCILHAILNNRLFGIEYICGNSIEFLEKLKQVPQEKLKDSIFLIDEEKSNISSYGSVARKQKFSDVQNIIAFNNISTIMLCPTHWANKEAMYGIRTFGRCFETKTVRGMLYNLQEKGTGAGLPLGCVYFPIFTAFAPKEYALNLERAYIEKKKSWISSEQRGTGDVLAELRKKSAEAFCNDKKYLSLTKVAEKMSYISFRLGSEWTTSEIRDVYQLTKLIEKGMI
jgi:hypothetical protein